MYKNLNNNLIFAEPLFENTPMTQEQKWIRRERAAYRRQNRTLKHQNWDRDIQTQLIARCREGARRIYDQFPRSVQAEDPGSINIHSYSIQEEVAVIATESTQSKIKIVA